MKQNIETLLTLVAEANDGFTQTHLNLSTVVGLLEKNLQGSNAVTVDNLQKEKRLMFIILNAHPDMVGIGVGKTGTDDFDFIAQYPLLALSAKLILTLMTEHLLN
ncbi:hypothetical protein E2R68_12330 [Psychromonas sp. RZ22]|uniref:hypothetical protein n=1 Tax=Psychromonas algarum TaxID=2555643 RepID=UPI001068A7EA|nr:hypothetical protein [Psychromonas sp. RZ22]TEW53483.1 hypothetical protein E2R68_12330 [Psychromonas sp. RZ22]